MWKKLTKFLFVNTSIRQTVAKNTFWLVTGEFLSRLLRAAIVVYAARILGASQWGVFSYVINLAALLTVVSDIGLSSILVREASRTPELRSAYLSTSFFIKLILLGASILFIIFIAPLFVKLAGASRLLLIVSFILIFDGLREFTFSLNRALEHMEWEAIIKVITNFLISTLGFAFLFFHPTPKALAASYLAGSALGFAAGAWTLRAYFNNLWKNFSKKLVMPILSSAWPFGISGLFSASMINMDMLVLGWFRSAGEVGLYAAAQRPIQFLYVIPSVFTASIFPSLARTAHTNPARFREIIEKSVAFLMLLAIPMAVGGIIAGKPLIQTLFGNEYAGATEVFQLLLVTLLLAFPSSLIFSALFASDKQKTIMWLVGCGALINAILDFSLIPRWGGEGSVVSTLLAQLTITIPAWLILKRSTGIEFFRFMKKIAGSAFVMGLSAGLLTFLNINVIFTVLFCGGIYGIILYLFKEPVVKEFLLLRKASEF